MKRVARTVIIILLIFFGSVYMYSYSLPPQIIELDELVHVETDKQEYHTGDIVKVSVFLSNPYPRRVKYRYYTQYGIDGYYEGEFNDAITNAVHVSPASDWHHLAPYERQYLIHSQKYTLNQLGEFHIILKIEGGSSYSITKTVEVS